MGNEKQRLATIDRPRSGSLGSAGGSSWRWSSCWWELHITRYFL